MYFFSLWNIIQFFSISNMVSEPLLWPFLSSLVFISVTSFSTSLPPSQQPPQLFTVEPLTSSIRRPWVSDLQPPSLRNFTLHKLLPFASPLQILLRSRFWRYHRDHLVPIYKIVKASMLSETARAPTRRSKALYSSNHAPHVPSTRRCTSGFSLTCLHAPLLQVTCLSRASTRLIPLADVIHVSLSLRHCWCHLLASAADIILWL